MRAAARAVTVAYLAFGVVTDVYVLAAIVARLFT